MIVKHYIELLRCYWWHVVLILVCSTAAFGVTGYYQLKSSPDYTAAASVLLIPSQAELEFGLAGRMTRSGMQSMSETYMEYVKSRPIVEAALAKIDAQLEPSEAESGLPFESEGSGLVGSIKSGLNSFSRKLTEWNMGTYVEIPDDERRVSRIQRAINVSNVASTHILQIEVTLDDPQYAALVANNLAEAYVERVTEESASDASELETYLQTQIDDREGKIEALRAERSRLDERFGIGNDYVSTIDEQMRLEEAQLVELHSRMLSVKLSQASASGAEARLVEPAIAPVYASTTGVVTMTQIGLLVGLILSAASIVIRDLLSETVRTSADLHRLVGGRSIGLLGRSRLKPVSKRTFKKFGLLLQQHFAVRLLAAPAKPELPHQESRLLLASPSAIDPMPDDAGVIELVQGNIWKHLSGAPKVQKIPHAGTATRSRASCFAQVTGLVSMEALCRATIHIAAGMASIGNTVYCKLPESEFKKRPRFKFRRSGEVLYEPPEHTEGTYASHITIECLGPLDAKFRVDSSSTRDVNCPLICVLGRDQIPEVVVQAMREKLEKTESGDWHFLLMPST